MGRRRKRNLVDAPEDAIPMYAYSGLLGELSLFTQGRHNLLIIGRGGIVNPSVAEISLSEGLV